MFKIVERHREVNKTVVADATKYLCDSVHILIVPLQNKHVTSKLAESLLSDPSLEGLKTPLYIVRGFPFGGAGGAESLEPLERQSVCNASPEADSYRLDALSPRSAGWPNP